MTHDDYPSTSYERDKLDLIKVREMLTGVYGKKEDLAVAWKSSNNEDLVEMVRELERSLGALDSRMRDAPYIETRLSPIELFNIVVIRQSITDSKARLDMV